MKIAVLGAGAVGLTVAAQLSGVCDVHAVCRKKHADAIREHGFIKTGLWGDEVCHFSASEELPDEDFDYIIITSKSTDTRAVCEQFRDTIRDHEVVSLQNGIGNEEIISEYTSKVTGGMIIVGFEWKGPGEVHVSVVGGPIKLGRFPGGPDPAVERLVKTFRAAGLNTEESPEIRGDLWGKTLYNCALNPLGALMEVPYGKLLNPSAWHIIEGIVEEAFAVCEAEAVPLAWETSEEYLRDLHDVLVPDTAEHHSSMYQDLHLRRKTEIDFLCGAVVRKGRKHGLDTPVNRTLVDLIRFREALLGISG